MFKNCCGDCGECWYVGNPRTCTCPDETTKRTWVGLTDEERNDCLVDADPCECLADPEAEELMRCIEAKLKDKNT